VADEHVNITKFVLNNFIKMANFLLNFCQLDENSEYLDTWIPDNQEMTPFLRLHDVILGAVVA
jgi:hypothetical protein